MIDRRLFLISGLAGLANPGAVPDPAGPAVTASGDAPFDAWSRAFVGRAAAAGLEPEFVRRQLADLTPDATVVAADRRQPEFSRPVGDYMAAAASPGRIAEGKARLQALAEPLMAIQARYGMEPPILVAVWAIESNFGTRQGGYDVVRSLATLAADGRRREWAEGELLNALRIVQQGRAERSQLTGSWAGAMGQTQFMPSSYLKLAVDGDGDGKADIWGSALDALASAANLLSRAGWRTGEDWAREVILPDGFDFALADGPTRPVSAWTAQGLKRADGGSWPVPELPAVVIVPAGAKGPAFLAFHNHYVIRKYNNSATYALAVGLIADGMAGAPALATPWPQEAPLTLAEQTAAQSALQAMGYEPGQADGMFGTQSRAALRKWQIAKGLPADGHLTLDLVARLIAEAPKGAPAA